MYYASIITSGRFGSFENELRKRSYYWTTLRDVVTRLECIIMRIGRTS